MAFSALFFLKLGNVDVDTPTVGYESGSPSASVMAASRGGGAAVTAQRSGNGLLGKMAQKFSSGKSSADSGQTHVKVDRTIVNDWRGGARSTPSSTNSGMELAQQTTRTFQEAIADLRKFMSGAKSDTLILLAATALITPLCKMAGTSPILGFLAAGMLLGPNGFGVISGIHTTETMAELGIVFFLFEMGIELSVERLKSMKKDVFGLGLSQYIVTAGAIGGVAKVFGGLSASASIVIGGALSLSSSAFVLQLLKDKKALATRSGKASFGVLLLQDLAVVPLLVATPILAGTGSLASALGSACVKAAMALSGIALAGRYALNPIFRIVAGANSQEAFLGLILLTALGMSFLTEGLGLSNTLGAFLGGVLLSETKYRYQVEADIAPFRGILLGLFFVTVGFEIDIGLIISNVPLVSAIVAGIIGLKAAIATSLSLAFGLSLSNASKTGLILAQGGEFAFVAFGLARSCGILDPATTKLLLTCVSLTMALTPALDVLGGKLAKKFEEGADFTHYMGTDRDASEITNESDEFVVVVGYGVVGQVVCDLLDRKLIPYVGLEVNPNKAIKARNLGLPVFYGDVARPEIAEAFHIGKAKSVIVTIADKAEATRAVIALRRLYPDKPIFSRAKDADHAQRLQSTLDVAAMVPILPEDNLLLTLPFGGAVLRSLGAPAEEVNYILEAVRKEVLSGKELENFEEEVVLAQLGVEKPSVIEEAAEKKFRECADAVVVSDTDSPKTEKTEGDTDGEDCVVKLPEEVKELKPMLKQILEANLSTKKTVEKEVEEEELDIIVETQAAETD